jgi:drug/metabolite transporter (DMT)-like permease
MNPNFAYALAVGSNLCFSFASLIFADLARKTSSLWMNAFKALLAWACFGLCVLLFGLWTDLPASVFGALALSGGLGLAIGDIFLLTAYARMGSARTLILYGFQPVFIGVAAHFLFHQNLTWNQGVAVLFFLGCLFVFSLERFRREGHWEVIGLLAALVGVLFDNCGLLLSRWAFDHAPAMSSLQANFVRCTGALLVFALIGRVREMHLRRDWRRLQVRDRQLATLSAFLGTFLSLSLYLWAAKIGHLASLSALAGMGPIFSSGMECVYERKAPSRYLLIALALFLIGFSVLVGYHPPTSELGG